MNDFSSYHVMRYRLNGEVLAQKTHHCYEESSAWRIGHAWGFINNGDVLKNKTKIFRSRQNILHSLF